MSLSKSFQISRKLKLESMKLNQNTAEIQNESIQEEISPYSGGKNHYLIFEPTVNLNLFKKKDLLKIKHIMNEKFIEPNSSSTTTSQVSFQPKSLKICSLQQKKLSFFGKSFIRPFQMNMSPIKNLGFGTFGKEFEENYELLQVLGKVKNINILFIYGYIL